MTYGTLSTLDTLLSIRQSVLQFGEDRAWESIQIALDAHNAQLGEMMADLVERTTDTRRAYGTGDSKTFDELDQYGMPDVQKITAGVAVDFPLRRFGNNLQWTRQWLQTNTVAQLAAETNGHPRRRPPERHQADQARHLHPHQQHVRGSAGQPRQHQPGHQGVPQRR
jgi:hypothetical protein